MLLEDIQGTSKRILKPLLVTLIPPASDGLVVKTHQTALGIILSLFRILMMHLIGKQLYRNTEQEYQRYNIHPSVIAAPSRQTLISGRITYKTATSAHGVLYHTLVLKGQILQQCRNKQERNHYRQ